MSWRFYPLADCISEGVLVGEGKGGHKPKVAEFLTPEEAKARADARRHKIIRKERAA